MMTDSPSPARQLSDPAIASGSLEAAIPEKNKTNKKLCVYDVPGTGRPLVSRGLSAVAGWSREGLPRGLQELGQL